MPQEIKISLQAARVNAGLTQREMALKLGVSLSTIVHWENGSTAPNYEKMKQLSFLSGIPLDFIYVPKKST